MYASAARWRCERTVFTNLGSGDTFGVTVEITAEQHLAPTAFGDQLPTGISLVRWRE